MDHATADLILALQFEDLMSLGQNNHLTTASSGSTDAEVALDLYRDELRNNALLLSDRHLSTKFGEADGTEDEPPSPIESPTPNFDHLLTRYEEDRLQNCIACGDGHPIRNLITVPCGHCYCKPCIGGVDGVDETVGLFELAMKDESLFPPRCCKEPIPVAVGSPFLSESQVQQFEEKTIEHATTNKTYCHNSQCGRFILPSNITGGRAECPHCGLTTCSACNTVGHQGECPKDPAYVALMELAEAEGWKRCEQCKRLVELTFGCNHMTCICKAEFCYVCRIEWKNCPCPQWNEDRLIERREQVVARADGPLTVAQVQQIDEDLRDRHDAIYELVIDVCETDYDQWQPQDVKI